MRSDHPIRGRHVVKSIVCPMCVESDDVETAPALSETGEPLLTAQCTGPGHEEPYSWEMPDDSKAGRQAAQAFLAASGANGLPLVQRLELYPKLLDAVARFDCWVEYGAVEYEFGLAHPDVYEELVERMGHIALAGQKQWTVSAYLARMLGNLTRTGEVVYRPTEGTGRWHYNDDISSWRLPSVPADAPLLTWAAYAEQAGIHPDRWPILEDATD